MSLLSIVEPAGALLTGWNLLPGDKAGTVAVGASNPPSPPDEAGREAGRPDPRSRWELGEVG